MLKNQFAFYVFDIKLFYHSNILNTNDLFYEFYINF